MVEAPNLKSPSQLFARLMITGLSIVFGLIIIVLVSAELVLPLDSAHKSGLHHIIISLSLAGLVGASLGAWKSIRASRLVYDVLQSGLEGEGPPGFPSALALQSAYRAPIRILWWLALSGACVFITDVVLDGSLTGLSGNALWLMWFYVLSWLPLGFYPMMVLWRRAFWDWLSVVPPGEFTLATDGRLVRRTMNRVFWPLLSVGLVLTSVMVTTSIGESRPRLELSSWASFVVLGVPLIGGWAAWRVGRVLADDLRRVSDWIQRIVEGRASGVRPICVTVTGGEVASAVERLRMSYDSLTDAEAQKRREAVDAREMKSRLFAYMSHDLRSPLNSIRGFAQILARQTDGVLNASQLESVDLIRQSGDELLRLVTNLLDTAKIEAGEMMLHRSWAPPIETVSEAIGAIRAQAEERGVRLEARVGAGLPLMYVDAQRVLQAVTVMLDHVVRSTRGDEVRVEASVKSPSSQEERALVIAVIDTEGGMREEDREKVAQILQDEGERNSGAGEATGLGLSLARALLKAHGGGLNWHSTPTAQARLEAWVPVRGPEKQPE